jgi:hypothetical protein
MLSAQAGINDEPLRHLRDVALGGAPHHAGEFGAPEPVLQCISGEWAQPDVD